MSKIIINDIIKKNKIPRETIRTAKRIQKSEIETKEEITSQKKHGFWFKIFLWILCIVIFLVILNFGINLFSSILVKITPVQEFVNVDLNLRAERGAVSGKLPFEIVQMEYHQSQAITATGVNSDGQKASGQIVVYNTYSSVAQLLIANTRFETLDGKIYRIKDKITVPGGGSVETTVYADQPGEEYNIGLADFTIPGFKGDPRYEKIYARSKTKMIGGSKNASAFLAEGDIKKANEELENKIKNYLSENISKQKPSGYIFFSNGLIISSSENIDNPQKGDIGKEFVFSQNGIGVGFLIKNENLSKEIIKRYFNQDMINKIKIVDLEKLKFNLLSDNQKNTEINFGLKGSAHFVWKVDEETLLNDLSGLSGSDYGLVFKNYSAIESAEVIFKPSWWHIIPQNKAHIHFEEILKTE